MTTDDERAEHLLARGRPAGPRLDRLWERVAPSIVQSPTRRFGLGHAFFLLLPLLAASLVVIVGTDRSSPAFVARGPASPIPPQLEATCGTAATPCLIDQPVYLRLLPRHSGGFVYVRLPRSAGGVAVAGPLAVNAHQAVAVPIRIRPEAREVPGGLDIEAVWVPSPLSGQDPDAELRAVTDGARSVLHLVVAP